MNKLQVIDNKKIESMIYEIRGTQIILDRDLAYLYKTETRVINQIVKRNKDRFPEEFCFQLSDNEFENWKSQIVISNSEKMSLRRRPHAFTEQGVAMMSALLKTDIAVKQSVAIINTFVMMRRFLSSNMLEQNFYKNKILEHDERIRLLEDNFSTKTVSNEIFFDGQIYDAYSLLLNIINSAKESIIIIDNYLSKELLDLLCETNKNIIVHSKNINDTLINKYSSQYYNVTFKIDNRFHDRFIIVDKKDVYHSGASFKDLGKRCFCISKINDKDVINNLLSRL